MREIKKVLKEVDEIVRTCDVCMREITPAIKVSQCHRCYKDLCEDCVEQDHYRRPICKDCNTICKEIVPKIKEINSTRAHLYAELNILERDMKKKCMDRWEDVKRQRKLNEMP